MLENRPLHGDHRQLGKIALAGDPVAADLISVRLMGFDPGLGIFDGPARFVGNGSPGQIDIIAEQLPQQVVPFDVLAEFCHLHLHA